MDKLVHYANLDGRLNVFYSTPSRYVAAKHSYGAAWPLKTDDFFPYADTPVSYWTSGGPFQPQSWSTDQSNAAAGNQPLRLPVMLLDHVSGCRHSCMHVASCFPLSRASS